LYGNYREAERDFKSALKINEKFAYSIRNLGQVYLEKGDYKKALATYKKYLKKAPDDAGRATAYDGIARTFMRLGQRDSVTANFQKSLELNMFDFVPIELLNDLYLEQGDTTRSQTMLQETYGRVKKIADSGIMRMNATFFLTWLALFGNVNREETIEIVINEIKRIEDTPAVMADKLNLANLKFFLTMLYIQTNQDERIEALWPKQQDVIPEEFWPMLKGVQNQTYSTNWRAYTILNKIFYGYFERGLAFYKPLIKYTSEYEVKPMEMMFRLFLADLYLHVGKVAEADGQRRIVGMPAESTWLVIGPFDNKDGFRKKFPPEKKIELDRAYKEKSRELTWQPANDGMEDGFINLKEIYKPYNWSVAYGLIDVESPEEKEVQFRFGTDDGCKVWLNDQQIWGFNQGGPAILDDNKVNVKLNQGRNKILIKVCNTVSDWGFFFRVTDKEGNGVADVRFVKGDE
jgi:tetratricopeptide (TPR) repeat protein